MRRFALTAALVAATVVPAAAQVRVGEPAPNFRGQFSRLEVSSLAELRGRTVLVEFWRTW